MTDLRRFRDMSLTGDEAAALVFEHWEDGTDAGVDRLVRVQVRARSLFPLWRKWGIERERLWGVVQAIELDMEIDYAMPPDRLELIDRLDRFMVRMQAVAMTAGINCHLSARSLLERIKRWPRGR